MATKPSFSDLVNVISKSELPAKSVLQDGFMKKDSLPPYRTSRRILKRERKKESLKSKGDKWFNMPAPEMTKETRHDLTVLRMRSVLDPKRFYKKNEISVLPKYFQVGTIVETKADFYSSRIPKKQRKRTLVDELLADADFKKHRMKHQVVKPAKRQRTDKHKRKGKKKQKK